MNNKTNTIIENAVNNVICCWISNHQALNEKHLELLQPQLFVEPKHRDIVEAIHVLYKKGNGIDINSILYWLKENNKAVSETEQYLLKLPTLGVFLFRYQQDISVLQRAVKAREKSKLIKQLQETKFSDKENSNRIIGELRNLFNETEQYDDEENSNEITSRTAWEVIEKIHKKREETKALKEKTGGKEIKLSTNYKTLDTKVDFFRRGELMVVGARPGTGKTTFVMNLIFNNYKNTYPIIVGTDKSKEPSPENSEAAFQYLVNALYGEEASPTTIESPGIGFISLEMEDRVIMSKLLALEADLPWSATLDYIDNKESEYTSHIQNCEYKFKPANLHIVYNRDLNINDVCKQIRQWNKERNVQTVFIDYLQLITKEHKKIDETLNEQVGSVSRILQKLAGELKITIIVLSQLNRNIEARGDKDKVKVPTLSDLRDSGSIEQDAAVVAFLIPASEGGEENLIKLYIKKNRYGEPGEIAFYFDRDKGKFNEKGTFGQ